MFIKGPEVFAGARECGAPAVVEGTLILAGLRDWRHLDRALALERLWKEPFHVLLAAPWQLVLTPCDGLGLAAAGRGHPTLLPDET